MPVSSTRWTMTHPCECPQKASKFIPSRPEPDLFLFPMLVLVPGRSGIRIGAPYEAFYNLDSKAFFMMTTQGQSGEIWQDAAFHFFSVESHAQVMLFHSCHHSTTINRICSVTINNARSLSKHRSLHICLHETKYFQVATS